MSEQSEISRKKPAKRNQTQQRERWLAVITIASLIVAWIVGYKLESGEVEPYLAQAAPEASRFEKLSSTTYAAYAGENEQDLVGYAAVGEANGYGGPLKLAVAVDLEGNVTGITVIKHGESPSWYRKVMGSGFSEQIIGKSVQDQFMLGEDIDGISSATYTSRAIADAVFQGAQQVGGQLGLPLAERAKPKVVFGIPEITLLALFAVGFVGHQSKFKYTKHLRWIAMLVGMVVLGFIYNAPLTLANINKFLLGYWPEWRTSLYWYFLIGGILFVFTVDNKNPYCYWFCPFGSVQECLDAVGGAKVYSPGKYREFLKWLRRVVVWLAIIVALLFRNPGISSYEIFGTLFSLLGSNTQFVLLSLVLIASLFIKRPWCTYLCPLDPVVDYIRLARKWILELWPKRTKKIVN